MDEQRFEILYRTVARRLAVYVARLTHDIALAEDITQDAFVRMLTSARAGLSDEDARRYVYRVATNLVRDHMRRRAAEERRDDASEPMRRGSSDAIDLRLDLEPSLAAISPRDRQLLWLAYVEGYSHREIARIAGLSALSVRPLLFRARTRLLNDLRRRDLSSFSAIGSLNG